MNTYGWIDLRSDTVTTPTPAMREAIAQAAVGDDVYQDDPTTNELERVGAEILGKEAALFTPSGTMSNQLGIMSQTNRGDEIIVGLNAHIFVHEVGAPAVLSGVSMRLIDYPDCVPDLAMIKAAVRSTDIHEPPTRLICMENALANGGVVPVERMKEIYEFAKSRGFSVHLDGARVFNAATSLGVDVKEITQYTDTVNCCLSKGLCAPVGSLLAGPADVIKRARKCRKILGGGMRQTGILTAAGLIAIRDMTKRLAEDHENARYLANRLAEIPCVYVAMDRLAINMVFFKMDVTQEEFDVMREKLKAQKIEIGAQDPAEVRFVAHNDITRADLDTVVAAMKQALC